MAYQGFSGSGTVGNFASTTILQNMYPAARHAGRLATVENTPGTVTLYFSSGDQWIASIDGNFVGSFASTTVMQAAYPAASNPGKRANLSVSPYSQYVSNGVAWLSVPTLNSAGTALVDGAGNTAPLPVMGLSTTNSAAAATANTALIQAALTAGGMVQILAPGTYYTNSLMTVYDDTHLLLGTGVTIKQIDSNANGVTMFRNSNYASTVLTASGNITSAISGLTGYITASVTVAGFTGVAGNRVLIKGDTTNVYNGVWRVLNYTGGVLTFSVMSPTVVGTSSGTITVALANGNITFEGGTIDYNAQNGNNTGALNNVHAVIMNKVGDLRVRNQKGLNGAKYIYYVCNADRFGGEGLTFNTGSDGYHMQGPCWNGRWAGISGQTSDDCIAFTTTNLNYSSYDLPDGNGDFFNMQISDIQEMQSTAHRCILLEANQGFGFYGIKIDGVHCVHNGFIAVALTTQDATSGFMQDVDIKNISGGYGTGSAGAVHIFGPAASGLLTITNLTVNGVRPRNPTTGVSGLVRIGGRLAANQIAISNVIQRPLSLVSSIIVSGSLVDIKQLIVEKCYADFDLTNAAAARQLLQVEAGTFKHIIVRDCYLTGTGTTRQGQLVTVFNPAVQTRVDIENCYHDGNTFAFLPNSITNIPTVRLSGTKHAGLFVISTSDSYNLVVNNIEIISCSGGTAFNNGATSKTLGIHAYGIRNTGGVTLFGYGTTNTFNVTGSDGTVVLKTDTAGHTFTISAGCILNDTQTAAAGVYAKGPTAYTRIAA